jgi:hypothetical protein
VLDLTLPSEDRPHAGQDVHAGREPAFDEVMGDVEGLLLGAYGRHDDEDRRSGVRGTLHRKQGTGGPPRRQAREASLQGVRIDQEVRARQSFS